MTESAPWYLSERAEQFAVMLLTRLENVQVSRMARDGGVDLQVSVDPQHSAGRIFGIEVKATRKLNSLVNSNGMVKRDITSRLDQSTRDYPFPVGVLIVDVVADIARFGWILKPESRAPIFTGSIHTNIATNDVMRRSVEEVRRWYNKRASRN